MQGTITRRAAGLGLMMAMSLVMAQQPGTAESPGAIQQQQQQELERRLREERIQQRPVAPEISVPQGGPTAPASTAKTIRVKQILIDRSEILTQAQIDAIINPLEGQTVSLADLQQAIDALNALYTAAGQATARAILPPQTVKDGLVRFRLVEAKVGDVRVNGAEAIDPAFILNRVTLEAGELLSVPVLESALVRFNRLHSTQLRAGVVAGSQFGTTDVEITAVEPPRTKFSVFFDNAGRDTVGETRAGVNARFANLLGRSDTLQFLATGTEGSENYALYYSVPLDWKDLRLDLSASKGDIDIVSGPFEPLDISGSSSDFTAGLTYPLIVTFEDMWSVYGRISARESSSSFGGLEQEKLNLRVFTAGISGEHQSDDTAWYVDHSLASGTTALGGDQRFLYYRGSATRFDRLSERYQLLLRGGLQLSDTRFLPASELFQIGGAYTVRGFSEGLLSGRNGYFVSAELRIGRTLAEYQAANPNDPVLHGIVFIDHGGALPYRPGKLKKSTHDDYLTSVGVGVLFDFSERITGRIVIGQPLRSNPAELHDKQPRAHVSINIALN